MTNIRLPAHIRFSPFHTHPTDRTCDAYDILVSDEKKKMIPVELSEIEDLSSIRAAYDKALRIGEEWVRNYLNRNPDLIA